MTINDALATAKIDPTDGAVLLADLLGKDRAWLLAHGEEELPQHLEKQWHERAARRRGGKPVAYITGHKDFYGRSFIVTPATLIPRPATEGLVELTLEIVHDEQKGILKREIDTGIVAVANIWGSLDEVHTLVDVGTGSGCIAVTLACELPNFSAIATDLSRDTLDVALRNTKTHGVTDRIGFIQGDLLEPLQTFDQPFLVVSNPPYIPEGTTLDRDVADFEPHGALFAGKDGADVIRMLIAQAKTHPFCRGLIVECREEQAKLLEELAS